MGQDCRVCFTLMIEYTESEKIIKAKMCKGLSTARTKTLDSALVPDDCETVFDVIERVKVLAWKIFYISNCSTVKLQNSGLF